MLQDVPGALLDVVNEGQCLAQDALIVRCVVDIQLKSVQVDEEHLNHVDLEHNQ